MTVPKLDLPARWLDAAQLRAAVRGEERGISRKTALYLLATQVDIENRHLDFRSVLERADESRTMRYLAALYLGRIDTREAVSILEQNLRIEDELVLGRVLRSLAGIGDAESLRRIGEIRARLHGWVAEEAEWAVRLLAHRHGVAGHEVPMPREEEYLELGGRASRDLGIREATAGEKVALRKAIELEPLGLSVAWDHVYHLHCGPRTMLLVLNSQVIEGGTRRHEVRSCALAGIIGHWRHHDGAFAPRYFMLTCEAPSADGLNVTLWNTNGRLVLAGFAGAVAGGDLGFAIRSVGRFGAQRVDVAGTLARGRIDPSRMRVGTRVTARKVAVRSAIP